ncbi:MAG: hypothetical protein ABS76_13105 [Pelagibacterium sp. SCN 64-44]|nr:MAG: hypothetical protein ABS76_13105 [Pelagibacterium sp. SCN 64-44]
MMRVVATGLRKTYGATLALRGLDLELRGGEIVGLAGPNGAGKSTLTRILAGEERADDGAVSIVDPNGSRRECWRHVAVVHQEPHVWPNMTVSANLCVGKERNWFGAMRPSPGADDILRRLNIAQFADYQLGDLSLAVRQRVEIARALLSKAEVFLFDEPNSALNETESEELFRTMEELAKDGKVVLLITHRLKDFVRSCERVVVIRDGLVAEQIVGGDLTEETIAVALSSEDLVKGRAGGKAQRSGETGAYYAIRNWSDRLDQFKEVSLDLNRRSITALAGVEGSGAREFLQAIAGHRALAEPLKTAEGPVSASYLAASRKDTVFANMSVGENLLVRLSWAELSGSTALLDDAKGSRKATESIKRYRIKAGSPDHSITSLSGGNQQKVVLGAAMMNGADLLAVEEPTRGVDIASSTEIYKLLEDYACTGKSVLLYCTEAQEIVQVADRLVIFNEGRVVREVDLDGSMTLANISAMLAEAERGGSHPRSAQ